MKKYSIFYVVFLFLFCVVFFRHTPAREPVEKKKSAEPSGKGIFLPGTQPDNLDIEFAKVDQCELCHASTKNGLADPCFSWQGSMMSQAVRDPVFLAALTVANQDIKGVVEY